MLFLKNIKMFLGKILVTEQDFVLFERIMNIVHFYLFTGMFMDYNRKNSDIKWFINKKSLQG